MLTNSRRLPSIPETSKYQVRKVDKIEATIVQNTYIPSQNASESELPWRAHNVNHHRLRANNPSEITYTKPIAANT